jgi:uroporphyrinogen decarboxylase
MNLSWEVASRGGHDSNRVIDDWPKLDEFIEKLPDPEKDPAFDELAERAHEAHKRDIYLLCGWWRLFFEKPWGLRGMQDLMVDYYTEQENVHKLHAALAGQYLRYLARAKRDFELDGFWTSDDLGHQTQLMMAPVTFRELIKLYYVTIGEGLKSIGIRHWWLHSCGNNTEIMGDLAEAGVTVFHPVQKGTMDERSIAREFGDKLCFLAGMDVQHVLQEESPERVREEVRFIIDTFDRPEGGLCIAAGNGIVSGTPFENIEAFLDEALRYGEEHRSRM